jgi:hypothetical protein
MGAQQVKCSCGKWSAVEIKADYENKKGLFGLDGIVELTEYRGWSRRLHIFHAYPCENCAKKIGDKLDQVESCDYEMTKSEKGYWIRDLP